jgi:hypothetical protein
MRRPVDADGVRTFMRALGLAARSVTFLHDDR